MSLAAAVVVRSLPPCSRWWRSEPVWLDRLRYPLRYEAIVAAHARNYDLDPALLAAVIYTESRFRADARSSAGAIGLMQLLPETGRAIAVRTGGERFVVGDLLDPEINVRYGSWYLRELMRKYDSTRTALAAYHAGQGNVDRWREQGVGIQFPETRAYVGRRGRVVPVYRRAYRDELAPVKSRSPGRRQQAVERPRIASPTSSTTTSGSGGSKPNPRCDDDAVEHQPEKASDLLLREVVANRAGGLLLLELRPHARPNVRGCALLPPLAEGLVGSERRPNSR